MDRKNKESVTAGWDSIVLTLKDDGRIVLDSEGMYFNNTALSLDKDEAIRLSEALIRLVNRG